MDGFWYPWGGTVGSNTPAQYVATWRHIHDVFQRVGATNVTWVWSVNHESIPRTKENQIENYWPGSRYVDWVGISGFNPGEATTFGGWESFQEVMTDRYRQLLRYGKPIAVTETGAPEVGGNKAAWIEQAYASLGGAFRDLKLVIWYDQKDNRLEDWRIDSSPRALRAFRRSIRSDHVLGADAALTAAYAD
jgi:beta-mannanase